MPTERFAVGVLRQFARDVWEALTTDDPDAFRERLNAQLAAIEAELLALKAAQEKPRRTPGRL